MINPRGSTGYGQKFVDDIRDDWGGKVYDDLMKGTDYALAHYSFIDGTRTAAAGGSYGGYLMGWFGSATGRLNALLSHARPFCKSGMFGRHPEVWFTEAGTARQPWANAARHPQCAPAASPPR